MTQYSETSIKKGRGRSQKSRDLIEAMRAIAEAVQPVTGRGIGYKLFIQSLIASMARSEMQRVYRLLKLAREEGVIPPGRIGNRKSESSRSPPHQTLGRSRMRLICIACHRSPFAVLTIVMSDRANDDYAISHRA